MKELVDQISARLRDQKIEVPDEEIASRLKKLIDGFSRAGGRGQKIGFELFPQRARRNAPGQGKLREGQDLRDQGAPARWVDLEVKVLDLWEPATEAISQTGLVGDGIRVHEICQMGQVRSAQSGAGQELSA